ncbi:MAG TPA: DUF2267 domain-containing protein [Anaerolineales bacterium]
MQFDDFIHRVQEQARLGTRDEAISITKAVLETLGERLDRKVRNGLESQIPNELKDFLLAREEDADRYNLREFYNRVGARADLKYQGAVERTRQVFSVLREAIPEGEIQDILESLPSEYEALFEKEIPNR